MIDKMEYPQHFRSVVRFYEHSDREICARHTVTQTELDILAFLRSHPDLDTASAIVENRMLKKGNVSRAVDSLIRKGLLSRMPDRGDRRLIHLLLTARSKPVLSDLERSHQQVTELLFVGFTEEERTMYREMSKRIFRNVERSDSSPQ